MTPTGNLNFDLKIFDAQTNDEYVDDTYQIPRNSSMLVKRTQAGEGAASRYLTGVAYLPRGVRSAAGVAGLTPFASSIQQSNIVTSSLPPPTFSNVSSSTYSVPGFNSAPVAMPNIVPFQQPPLPGLVQPPQQTISGDTESDQIKAMFDQTGMHWERQAAQLTFVAGRGGHNNSYRARFAPQTQPAPAPPLPPNADGTLAAPVAPVDSSGTYVPSSMGQNRIPPANYVCFRCGVKGHWKQFCPELNNKDFDNFRFKRTTGIPRSFLRTIPGDEGGNAGSMVPGSSTSHMINPDGEKVVAQLNATPFERWTKQSAQPSGVIDDDILHSIACDFQQEWEADENRDVQKPWISAQLACSLCTGLAREAVRQPCCQKVFCDVCLRESLQLSISAQVAQAQASNNVMGIRIECPGCAQVTDLDRSAMDKPVRALVDQQLKRVNQEVRRRKNQEAADAEKALNEANEVPSIENTIISDVVKPDADHHSNEDVHSVSESRRHDDHRQDKDRSPTQSRGGHSDRRRSLSPTSRRRRRSRESKRRSRDPSRESKRRSRDHSRDAGHRSSRDDGYSRSDKYKSSRDRSRDRRRSRSRDRRSSRR